MVLFILEDIVPDDCSVIKRALMFSPGTYQQSTPVVVMTVIALYDGVFTKIVTVKAAGIHFTLIINCIAGLIELPERIVAVIGIGCIPPLL